MDHHEDNNTQHLMDNNYAQNLLGGMDNNMQMTCGGDLVGDMGMGLGDGHHVATAFDAVANSMMGGKFEELAVGNNQLLLQSDGVGSHGADDDDEERKYIEEIQQSEKQQTMGYQHDFLMDNGNGVHHEMPETITGNDNYNHQNNHHAHEFEQNNYFNSNGVGIDGGEHVLPQQSMHGNQVGFGDEDELEILKNDGDFSTHSNTISTTAEEDANAGVLQVEMKIEEAPLQLDMQSKFDMDAALAAAAAGNADEHEEEEPSSLATNGTSSLSEQAPMWLSHEQHTQQQQQLELHSFDDDQEDKENADPLVAQTNTAVAAADFADGAASAERPTNIDFEINSQLNPDAKEFVPTFGSNPASPTAAFGDQHADFESQMAEFEAKSAVPISAMPRHMLDDDFLAGSPRKGRGSDMDGISLPAECDFENEAAKRPHELEQEEDLIGSNGVPSMENVNVINTALATDAPDFIPEAHSPADSFIDHGPETSVDLDADMEMAPQQHVEPFKQQPQNVFNEADAALFEPNNVENVVRAADEPIEDLLNTVQPIPTDSESLDTSFIEPAAQSDLVEKELLQVEEKENLSQLSTPCSEEINLKNTIEEQNITKSAFEPTICIDMNSADNMQTSFYLEHTSGDAQVLEQQQAEQQNFMLENSAQHAVQEEPNKLFNTSELDKQNASLLDNECEEEDASFERMRSSETEIESHMELLPPQQLMLDEESQLQEQMQCQPHFETFDKPMESNCAPMSPLAAEEKHLLEQTRENEAAVIAQPQFEHEIIDSLQEDAAQTHFSENTNASTFVLEQKMDALSLDDEFEQHTNKIDSLPEQAQGIPQEPCQVDEYIAQPIEDVKQHSEAAEQPICEQQQPTEPEPVVEPATLENKNILDFTEKALDSPLPHIPEASSTPYVEAGPTTAAIEAALGGVAAAAAVGVVAATATAAAKKKSATTTSTTAKKAPTATKSAASSAAAKPKIELTKKPLEKKTASTTTAAKKPEPKPAAISLATTVRKTTTSATTSAPAARPRTAPAATKTAATVDKKPLTSTVKPSSAAGTAARKPLATSSAPRSAVKTTTTAAARPAAAATAAATKPRPATAPSKPTSLGLSTAAAKPKAASPRSAVAGTSTTTQVRKTTTTTASSVGRSASTAKSPTKAPLSNGVASRTSSAATSTTSRLTKTTASTTSTTTTTSSAAKPFTARPAPKFAHSTTSTTSTTRRSLAPTSTAKATVPTSARKSSPLKPMSTTAKASPLKSTTGAAALKAKTNTKDAVSKPSAGSNKPTPITKKSPAPAKSNGAAGDPEEINLNGESNETAAMQNGNYSDILQNGNSAVAEEHPAAPIEIPSQAQEPATAEVA